MAKKYLHCEETGLNLYPNDIVTIASQPNIKYIVKCGWYQLGSSYNDDWHFVSISDKSIIPYTDVNLADVSKVSQSRSSAETDQEDTRVLPVPPKVTPPSEADNSAKTESDTTPVVLNYLVIPGTDVRIYDGDIIKISNKPRTKWVVHYGWFIYQEVQNYDWYLVSISTGDILPASVIDLTLCTLLTIKTQGSTWYDGKVVNYTRPYTAADAEALNRTFITVDTIEQRNNIDPHTLVNGRVVRVNDVAGLVQYYAYNAANKDWDLIDQGGGGGGIPELIGTPTKPIILSTLEKGLYRIKGVYMISPTDDKTITTRVDRLAFISETGVITIKVISDTSITDYLVEDDHVTFSTEYATEVYVDNKTSIIEAQISEIISELSRFIKKSSDPGASFNAGQWAVFDGSGNIKGVNSTAANVDYVPPESGPTSTVSNVQNAIDILNARSDTGALYDTEENWNAQPQLIAARGSISVYSRYRCYLASDLSRQ